MNFGVYTHLLKSNVSGSVESELKVVTCFIYKLVSMVLNKLNSIKQIEKHARVT